MRKLVFVVTVGLLAVAILSAGCAKTPAPAAPTTQNVTGTLKVLNTPDDPGKDVVTIQTPQGEKTFVLTAGTTYSIEGRSCVLAELGKAVDEGNVTYECTVILAGISPYGDDTAAMAVYVKKQ